MRTRHSARFYALRAASGAARSRHAPYITTRQRDSLFIKGEILFSVKRMLGGAYTRPTYPVYHRIMHKSICNMYKSFFITLAILRMDEPLRVWYSIVTERKQPEIRKTNFQVKPLSQSSHKDRSWNDRQLKEDFLRSKDQTETL